MRSIGALLVVGPASKRPPGGWKWMPFGAGSRNEPANRLGGSPKARANARVNASSDP